MKKLKMGMVGGGIGAFIGEVHRKAARMDGGVEFVAGAFDIDPEKSLEQGRILGVDPKRTYRTYDEMIKAELALPKGERVDFISICTPNHTHFPIAKACLEAGFNVMCEKPMTLTVEQALELDALVKKTKLTFGLMHTYTGYPMVKLARDMVEAGDLGKIRKVVVQYPQGWLFKLTGKENMQASWRTDPKRSGRAGCMGDIGTHAANLAEFVTGLRITEVLADLTIFVKGRKLDDDGNVLFHMEKGAKGVLTASQIAPGEENDLHIWVYGEKKALAWYQDLDVCKQVDNIDHVYDLDLLNRMYTYLSTHGDCYYIQYRGVLVGDVSLRNNAEISIVVCKEYQNLHIGRRCIVNMLVLAKEKSLKEVKANIYSFNTQSQKTFESVGFQKVSDEWYSYQIDVK